jgi:hypothetical protein
MSVRIMAAVFERSGLNPIPRFVLVALADHADHDGYAWPAVGRLCEKTGCSRNTVREALKEAVLAGELERAGARAVGRGNTTLYRVTLADPVDNVSEKGQPATLLFGKGSAADPFRGQKRVRSDPEKGQIGPIKGSAADPEPSKNQTQTARGFSTGGDDEEVTTSDPELARRHLARIRETLKRHPAGPPSEPEPAPEPAGLELVETPVIDDPFSNELESSLFDEGA